MQRGEPRAEAAWTGSLVMWEDGTSSTCCGFEFLWSCWGGQNRRNRRVQPEVKIKEGGQLGLQTNFAVSFIPLAEWHHICIRDDRKFTKRTVKVFHVLILTEGLRHWISPYIKKKREYWEFVSLDLLNPFRHVSFFQILVIVIRELKASGHFSQFINWFVFPCKVYVHWFALETLG